MSPPSDGWYEPQGERHDAVFIPAGDRLIVSFEVDDRIDDPATENAPRSWIMGREAGWSSLTIVSQGETWFRDPALYELFDLLTDDGFFDQFDEVLFFGTDSGAYAAAAFSVAAPGARVVALRPQATLDARYAGWDERHRKMRRLDFESRYGYAPEMIDAADAAYVLFDPDAREDAAHAAMFRRANVTYLRCHHLGTTIDRTLDGMDIFVPLLEGAMDGSLDEEGFARLFRTRRTHVHYLRRLIAHLEHRGQLSRALAVCHYAIEVTGRPLFSKRAEVIEEKLARETEAA